MASVCTLYVYTCMYIYRYIEYRLQICIYDSTLYVCLQTEDLRHCNVRAYVHVHVIVLVVEGLAMCCRYSNNTTQHAVLAEMPLTMHPLQWAAPQSLPCTSPLYI